MASITEINESLVNNNAKLIEQIKNEISTVRNELLTKISDISTSFTNEMADIRVATSSLNNEITLLKQQINQQDNRLMQQEDIIQRQERKNSLIIRNLPVFPEENLQEVFQNICSTLKCDLPSPLPLLFRLKNKLVIPSTKQRILRSNSTSSKKSINDAAVLTQRPANVIIKFAMDWQKSLFFKKYFEHGKLFLNNFGANIPIRIIICDNLTSNNYRIFCAALDAKFKGVFSKVSTFNGLVQVYDSNNKRMIISDTVKLKELTDYHNMEIK